MKKYRRVLQIELNEISIEVVEAMIAEGKLPNFKKLNQNYAFVKTESEQDYELLEPWIQWVTAHTGKTFAEHNIFRLSDVHQLKHSQIWEELSQNHIESGIIGSMNIIRRNTKGGIFFPDPWAIQNETYPNNLRPLWDLISRKVQGHATSKLTIADMLSAARACIKFKIPLSLYMAIAKQLVSQKLNPKNKWKLAGVFDLFLTAIFKNVVQSTKFGYYTLFLNSVAHYQHHYWRSFDGKNFDPSIKYPDINENDDPMRYGYMMYDKVLGQVMDLVNDDPDTLVIVLSGLSQIPYTAKEAEGGMNYYRLLDHKTFAQSIGLNIGFEIYPLMSRDWQVKYHTASDRLKALEILKGITYQGQALFNVSENTEGYIFIETKYTQGAAKNSDILLANGTSVGSFNSIFLNIAIKSGHHSGLGNLWISDRVMVNPSKYNTIPLTNIYNLTLGAFGIEKTANNLQSI